MAGGSVQDFRVLYDLVTVSRECIFRCFGACGDMLRAATDPVPGWEGGCACGSVSQETCQPQVQDVSS